MAINQRSIDLIKNNKTTILYVPSFILIIGTLLRFILQTLVYKGDESDFTKFRESIYAFSSDNWFNYFFVNHGFEIFSAFYWLVTYFSTPTPPISQMQDTQSLNFRDSGVIETIVPKTVIRTHLYRYFAVSTVFVLLLALKKIISVLSGVEISGHFMALMTFTMFLYLHIQSTLADRCLGASQAQVLEQYVQSTERLLIFLAMLLIGVWSFLLLITTVFYHTLPEKITGLLLGYLPTYLTFRFF